MRDAWIFFFFFCAHWAYCYIISGVGVVSGTLHPAVWDTHISSLQFARGLNCQLVQAYKTPSSCGEGLFVNLFGVRPIPTGYSLHALNPLLPGLEPGPHNRPKLSYTAGACLSWSPMNPAKIIYWAGHQKIFMFPREVFFVCVLLRFKKLRFLSRHWPLTSISTEDSYDPG